MTWDEAVVQAQGVREIASADRVLAELHRQMERLRLLSDACDRALRDPDDPERYRIAPRAEEVLVTYEERSGGQPVRKVAPLSVLLARAAGASVRVVSWETTSADPCMLLLKTAAAKGAYLQLVTEILGDLHNVQEHERFEAAVLEAIGAVEPTVRARIVEGLRERQGYL